MDTPHITEVIPAREGLPRPGVRFVVVTPSAVRDFGDDSYAFEGWALVEPKDGHSSFALEPIIYYQGKIRLLEDVRSHIQNAMRIEYPTKKLEILTLHEGW